MQRNLKKQGLYLVGIAADEAVPKVMELKLKHELTFPMVLDGALKVFYKKYKASDQLPQTFIFDRLGRLRMVIRGKPDGFYETLETAVKTLL